MKLFWNCFCVAPDLMLCAVDAVMLDEFLDEIDPLDASILFWTIGYY